ncbi:hypothetical protein AB52_5383 [Escherichia coli 6-537-08_S1_C2]|nr:hypothetical protein ECDEC13C_1037 [Escherichia coli DEC13C]EMV26821.1 hypothetical protein ECBCE034MS14_0367 [Escherichia coli BCE034_MS-14]EMX00655.1 hypothetical protein ECTHROOPD_0948 [Escherichia coli ThroopD]EMX25226.1 hypothetical protein ECP03018671_5369 [Escherichia coli P0301867.1]ENA38385.1 hypothetical protein ECP03018672_5313 [Escherichia coli P0301867.2]ENA43590.1 hypothetical protein ECP03018674_5184 [Escherichia coli P0301867.4]ENA69184.1 hypothetical protein EC178900_5276 
MECSLYPWAFSFGSTDLVFEYFSAPCSLKRIPLQIQILVIG